jgi:indole-3-glycerol phosphate synthase
MILERIVHDTRQALPQRMAQVPESELERQIASRPHPLDLVAALRQPGVRLIAEIKRASPSRGALNLGLQPEEWALTYARAGADALSILTEPLHFRGRLEDLRDAGATLAAAGLPRPLLRKDFIIDRYQLLEARAAGADAALLIVAALADESLRALFQYALSLGLTPLVEVHDRQELDRALALNPPLVGINNRDLRTFQVSLEVTRALRPLIPAEIAVVSESGIRQPADMRELAAIGVDAALVGEALVTAPDPAAQIRALLEAGR